MRKRKVEKMRKREVEDAPFKRFVLKSDVDSFYQQILESVDFESMRPGVHGAVLVQPLHNRVPIVRTTTRYIKPAQAFPPCVLKLADCIVETAKPELSLNFNNAMAEIYDSRYQKMRYHSDQALDLADDSYICIFSCYKNGEPEFKHQLRVLNIMDKNEPSVCQTEPLNHNSIIIFSVSTNKQYCHQIVPFSAKQSRKGEENPWMGITLRFSKSWLEFKDVPRFYPSGRELKVATQEEVSKFCILKGRENRETDFTYRDVYYTLSPSDLMPVTQTEKKDRALSDQKSESSSEMDVDGEENVLLTRNLTLVYIEEHFASCDNLEINQRQRNELKELQQNFCGVLVSSLEELKKLSKTKNEEKDKRHVFYVVGNVEEIEKYLPSLHELVVIKEVAINYPGESEYIHHVSLGEVPRNVLDGVGVFMPCFFDSKTDIFEAFIKEHKPQTLRESTKMSASYRDGIYLSEVKKLDPRELDSSKDLDMKSDDEVLGFNYLRCSTNLAGPTENFRENDRMILDKTNGIVRHLFESPIQVNHVLAQVYNNVMGENGKTKKATISSHSDKTKDMPRNGIIAFATFYKGFLDGRFTESRMNRVQQGHEDDPYDWRYRKTSVLTTLRFMCKKDQKEFDVLLYPGSLFLISLSTNRLYTHTIVPPIMNELSVLPLRLGYVERCSKSKVVHVGGKAYMWIGSQWKQVEDGTHEQYSLLRRLYAAENQFEDLMFYDLAKLNFSMNKGDYMKPVL